MRSVGVRELKARTSEVLRQVHEAGETVEITNRGQVVALLIPAAKSAGKAEDDTTFWADWDRLSAEISAHWPKGVTAEEAVAEQRREL